MDTKICTKCQEEKEIANFYIRRTRNNQPKSICKECESKQKATPIKFVPDLEGEIWNDIYDFEGLYVVSNKDRVKRIMQRKNATQKLMNHSINKLGYHFVCLTKNGVNRNYFVSRLVAAAFIPNPDNKPHVNHLNGKDDNTPESLEWVTPLENIQHAWRTGLSTSKKGEKHNQSKLTEKEVLEIRASKLTPTEISLLYSVNIQAIYKILARLRWKHI